MLRAGVLRRRVTHMIGSSNLSTSEKAWRFVRTVRRLIDSAKYDNWDEEGAHAIPYEAWTPLRELAADGISALPRIRNPWPSVSGDGTIYLRWADNGRVFDVEWASDGNVYWVRRVGYKIESGNMAATPHSANSTRALLQQLRSTFV